MRKIKTKNKKKKKILEPEFKQIPRNYRIILFVSGLILAAIGYLLSLIPNYSLVVLILFTAFLCVGFLLIFIGIVGRVINRKYSLPEAMADNFILGIIGKILDAIF